MADRLDYVPQVVLRTPRVSFGYRPAFRQIRPWLWQESGLDQVEEMISNVLMRGVLHDRLLQATTIAFGSPDRAHTDRDGAQALRAIPVRSIRMRAE